MKLMMSRMRASVMKGWERRVDIAGEAPVVVESLEVS
jgi:hypothetical protein